MQTQWRKWPAKHRVVAPVVALLPKDYITLLGSKRSLETPEIAIFFIEVTNTRPYKGYVANFLGRLHRGMYLKHAHLA